MPEERPRMTTAALANRDEPTEPERTEMSPDEPVIGADESHGVITGGPTNSGEPDEKPAPLLATKEVGDFENRWDETQRDFVDDPRTSVKQADELVAELMQILASRFADEREKLEKQWDRGEEVSTEELRMALRRYRSFFHRLLAV